MPDEPTNTTPETPDASTGTPPAAPAGTPPAGDGTGGGERKFSQAEVDAIVLSAKQKAARAAEKKVRQEVEAKTEPEPKAQEKPQPQSGDSVVSRQEFEKLQTQLAEERKSRLFAESISGRDLDKKAIETLRKHFDPDDMESFEELVAIMPKATAAPKEPPKQESQTAAPANGANGATYKSPGGPAGPPAGEYETDARKWTGDMVSRFVEDGTFKQRVQRFRNGLPGGGGGYFVPKKGLGK